MAIAATHALGEQVIHLPVNWEIYKAIALQLGESANVRLSYDDGYLELMAPYSDHEAYKSLLDSMLTILSIEWGIEVYGVGSMTLEIEGSKSGEPDTSYYLQNTPRVYGMKKIDLTMSPSPDLVVEIDLSSQRRDKLDLYAKLNVSEFWRINHTGLRGYALALTGTYSLLSESGVIGGLQLGWLDVFLQRRLEPRTLVLKAWQEFIRDRKPRAIRDTSRGTNSDFIALFSTPSKRLSNERAC